MTRLFRFRSVGLLATMSALLSGACLVGEVRGVPCDADAACPENYFCDLPRTECREITDSFGPPRIEITAIRDDGEEVRTPFIPPEATTTLVLLPNNSGLSTAEDLGVSFGELECITFSVDLEGMSHSIEPGARGEIPVAFTPGQGCEGLTIIDWFITFSGRETRGVFDVNVKP